MGAFHGHVAVNQYLALREIGQGAHGAVQLVVDAADGRLYAMKVRVWWPAGQRPARSAPACPTPAAPRPLHTTPDGPPARSGRPPPAAAPRHGVLTGGCPPSLHALFILCARRAAARAGSWRTAARWSTSAASGGGPP